MSPLGHGFGLAFYSECELTIFSTQNSKDGDITSTIVHALGRLVHDRHWKPWVIGFFSRRTPLGKAGVEAIAACMLFRAVVVFSEAVLEEIEIGQHRSSTGNLLY